MGFQFLSQLLVSAEENRVELSNGCICCTINDSLVDKVYQVLEREERLDYLVVETTGLADPLPIMVTFLSTELRAFTHLDSVITMDVGLAAPPICLPDDEAGVQGLTPKSPHLAQDGFVSVPFKSDRPFQVDKFQHFLAAQMPLDVFRAKGILWFDGEDQRHVFQLSGKRCSISPEPWTAPPQTQLVFIGRQLNPLQLHQQLTNCLAGNRVSLLS